ncbi:MAG: hypothetical protein RIQ60_2289 [Pseudomonadota bacterium]|jgi:glycosyltransferase involved in cell wall biosynthesis
MKPSLFIVCRTGDSGVTDYSFCLAPELSKQWRVEFLTANSAGTHPARGQTEVIPVFRRVRNLYVDLFRYVYYILKKKPQWILMQSWVSIPLIDAVIVRFFRRLGCQVAITAHDVMPHHPYPWSRRSISFFYKSFNRLIVHSESAKNKLLEMNVRSPILVVPHGEYSIFNLDDLDKIGARRRLKIESESDFVILFFGHIDSRKGIFEFAKVAKNWRGSGVQFIVAGRSELSPSEEAKLMSGHCRFSRIDLGRVPFEKVQEYFAAADLVALPYREGTTSGVAKVAMAFSKPIVASDVGDLPELMREWPGVLISHTDIVNGLSAAIERVIAARGEFRNCSEKSRTKYKWDNIGLKYRDFLVS